MFRFLPQDRGQWFANDVAAAKDHDLRSLRVHAATDEQLLDPGGSAGHEATGSPSISLPTFAGWKPSTSFAGSTVA